MMELPPESNVYQAVVATIQCVLLILRPRELKANSHNKVLILTIDYCIGFYLEYSN